MFKKIMALTLIVTSTYCVNAFADYNIKKGEAFDYIQDDDFYCFYLNEFKESDIKIIHAEDFDSMGFQGEVFKLAGIKNDLYVYGNHGMIFYVDTNTGDVYKQQGGTGGEVFSQMNYRLETYPLEIRRWCWTRYDSPDRTKVWEYTGWLPENGWCGSDDIGWKYYDNGEMAFGWKQINGDWYYFTNYGRMCADCTIDGYYLSSDGRWQANK